MSVELTESQRQALDAAAGEPLRVTDPRTNEVYVLVRAETYERVSRIVDGFARRGSKMRPAVVVQADFLNGLIDDTVLVAVTRKVRAPSVTEAVLDPAVE